MPNINIKINFNPRSPCGERRQLFGNFVLQHNISIHAPRVGSDREAIAQLQRVKPFQSTLPVWGATLYLAWITPFQSTLPVWGATAENHNKYTIFW